LESVASVKSVANWATPSPISAKVSKKAARDRTPIRPPPSKSRVTRPPNRRFRRRNSQSPKVIAARLPFLPLITLQFFLPNKAIDDPLLSFHPAPNDLQRQPGSNVVFRSTERQQSSRRIHR